MQNCARAAMDFAIRSMYETKNTVNTNIYMLFHRPQKHISRFLMSAARNITHTELLCYVCYVSQLGQNADTADLNSALSTLNIQESRVRSRARSCQLHSPHATTPSESDLEPDHRTSHSPSSPPFRIFHVPHRNTMSPH